jgi:putative ABC transport system permease protein
MLHLAPIFRTLMRRKFGVFLLIIQIALATAIFSNLGFVSQDLDQTAMRPSGIPDDQLFSVDIRTIGSKLHYADVQRDMNNLQELPDIEQAALVGSVPLAGDAGDGTLRTRAEKDSPSQSVAKVGVSTLAISTMGLQIIAGRDFQEEDMAIQTPANNHWRKRCSKMNTQR